MRRRSRLLPGVKTPTEFRAIVNAHFHYVPPAGHAPLIGVVGGLVEWLFAFPQSPVDHHQQCRSFREHAARRARAADLATRSARPPTSRRRLAGRGRSCASAARRLRRRRSRMRCARARSLTFKNLFLAGDWTDTGSAGDHRGIGAIRRPRGRSRAGDALDLIRRRPRHVSRRRSRRYVEQMQIDHDPEITSRERGARDEHRIGEAGPAGLPAARRPLGVRARSRRHDSVRIRAAAALSRRAGRCRTRSARSPTICAASRAPMAAGRWCRTATFDMSASVKAYFALKMIGDRSRRAAYGARARGDPLARRRDPQQRLHALHAVDVRRAHLERSVPVLPVEIMLLPLWFPFHLNKMSYWARTTIVPLMVLAALKPRAQESRRASASTNCSCRIRAAIGAHAARAASEPRDVRVLHRHRHAAARRRTVLPEEAAQRAIDKAVAFFEERLNGEDGLGAIYPPMANTVMMYEVLGFPADHPPRAIHAPRHRQAAGDP